MSVSEALSSKVLSPSEAIDISDKLELTVISKKPNYMIAVTKHLSKKDMALRGSYDLKNSLFIDPRTGLHAEFKDLVGVVFEPEKVKVKDLHKTDRSLSLIKAVLSGAIDSKSGCMVDPRTGKIVSFFEAVKLGWISQVSDVTENKSRTPGMSISEAVSKGLLDAKSCRITNPTTGQTMNLAEALLEGILDSDSVIIRNPANDDLMTLTEAVENGVLNLNKGVLFNTDTQVELDLSEAFANGFVLSGEPRKPLSLVAVDEKGWLIDSLIEDQTTGQRVNIDEAIKRGIVDPFITLCKDSRANSFVSLDDALSTKLINPGSGKMRDTFTSKLVTLNEGLKSGLIVSDDVSIALLDALNQEYYSPKFGTFLNPCVGEEQTLGEAMDNGFIDCSSVRVKDSHKGDVVTVQKAIDSRLLDADKGLLIYPKKMTLDVAYQKGFFVTTRKPLALQEVLAQGCYDGKTGLLNLNDSEKMSLEDAIRLGDVNKSALTVKDPRSGDIISLSDAINTGLINPKRGIAIDPTSGTELNFYDALDQGLIVPAKRKFSLPEAVYKGFYDPVSGRFSTPETRERLQTDRAIRRGIIDPASTMVKLEDGSGKVLTFEHAVEEGIIDAKTGVIRVGTNKVDFQEAFEKGLLIEVRQPISLGEAVAKGIFDENTGLFIDPASGEYVTLSQALDSNLISSDLVNVKDTKSGLWKKLDLMDAIKQGYVDGRTGKVRDFNSSGDAIEISLKEALHTGLIVDNKCAISIQRAIHQGIYDDSSGKIIDPSTGRKITLHEAIRQFTINPLLPCYWDKNSEHLLSLAETCRAGIIDRRTGMFKEPGSNQIVPLSSAMELGLIVDIESAGFGLYEAIMMGFYDYQDNAGFFIHPSSGCNFSLAESLNQEIINPDLSLIKHYKTGEYVKLAEGINLKIIDDKKSMYCLIEEKTSISLTEAKRKGFIVPAKRPLSLEEAIKCGLFKRDVGRFADPMEVNGVALIDLYDAIQRGLIDPESTAIKDPSSGKLKSLNAGIEDGSINVHTGRVNDPKTGRMSLFDTAFKNGLFVNINKPVTYVEDSFRKQSNLGKLPELSTIKECSLLQAIEHELIDPNVAVTKNPQTGRFFKLSDAISCGLIDVSKQIFVEPQTGRVKPIMVSFEDGSCVFLKEPLSFDAAIEQGLLDLESGKFTDPASKEVLTLKEAIISGLIDPESVLVKDTTRRKLLKLPEAFRKGIMDSDKGNVLDTMTSRLYPLKSAVDCGLVTTHGFSLIESLDYGLYNPTSGTFTDPFCAAGGVVNRRRFSLADSISVGLVDPSSTVIKDPATGSISSLLDAIASNAVDANAGKLLETTTGRSIDLIKAKEHGYILPAEARVSVNIFVIIFTFY